MTCKACELAERSPRINEFTVGCTSCKARALAVTGAHEESAAAGAMTAQYRGALETLFGADWKDGHAQVKLWSSRAAQEKAKRVEK